MELGEDTVAECRLPAKPYAGHLTQVKLQGGVTVIPILQMRTLRCRVGKQPQATLWSGLLPLSPLTQGLLLILT